MVFASGNSQSAFASIPEAGNGPYPEFDDCAFVDLRPMETEELRLARRHEVVMGWLGLLHDLGAGYLLGLGLSLSMFMLALRQMGGV